MKKILFLIFLTLFFTSCQSMKSIETSPNCVVWRDQEFFGPYSTEVVDKKTTWDGSCRTANYQCRKVNISYDENNNILKDEIVIGKFENNKFIYTEKNSSNSLIVYTSVHVYPELKKVMATIVNGGAATETEYQFNLKCSSEQAAIGAIALGLIYQIQTTK